MLVANAPPQRQSFRGVRLPEHAQPDRQRVGHVRFSQAFYVLPLHVPADLSLVASQPLRRMLPLYRLTGQIRPPPHTGNLVERFELTDQKTYGITGPNHCGCSESQDMVHTQCPKDKTSGRL